MFRIYLEKKLCIRMEEHWQRRQECIEGADSRRGRRECFEVE